MCEMKFIPGESLSDIYFGMSYASLPKIYAFTFHNSYELFSEEDDSDEIYSVNVYYSRECGLFINFKYDKIIEMSSYDSFIFNDVEIIGNNINKNVMKLLFAKYNIVTEEEIYIIAGVEQYNMHIEGLGLMLQVDSYGYVQSAHCEIFKTDQSEFK